MSLSPNSEVHVCNSLIVIYCLIGLWKCLHKYFLDKNFYYFYNQFLTYLDLAVVFRTLSFTRSFPLYLSVILVLRSPISKYSSFISIPIAILPKRIATAKVVKEPENGSNTTSPTLEETLIILSKSASGFCVGFVHLEADTAEIPYIARNLFGIVRLRRVFSVIN